MRILTMLAFLAALTITLWAQSCWAQSTEESSLKKDIEALKEGQAAIQKELQELKNLLLRGRPAGAAPAPELVVSVDGAPFKGQKDAKVTLVDFTDYQ